MGKRVIQERDGSNTPLVSYTRGRDLSGSLREPAELVDCWRARLVRAAPGRRTTPISRMAMGTSLTC